MKKSPFQSFVNLVSFDQKIRSLLKKMEDVEYEISMLQSKEQKETQEVDADKKQVIVLRKSVDAKELELKELNQLESEKKQLLEKISNYKEYQSVKTEIESIQEAQLNQEQIVLAAWSELETAQKKLKKKETIHVQELVTIKKTIEEKEEEFAFLQKELSTYKQQRPEKEERVPKEWLEKYTVMKARISDPVVPIRQGACGACFFALTDQNIIRARKGALLQCKG
ncbi:MAG: hypothetical protein WCD44_01660, partial [Candidatus Babeliales bacterium]